MRAAWRTVQATDRVLAGSRATWSWLGQAALIVLGTHLACDQLDDHVMGALQVLPLGWSDPTAAAVPSAWLAVALELAVAAWVVIVLWRALPGAPMTWARWKRELCLRNVVVPLFWIPVALAGCWVIAMATVDLLLPLDPTLARIAGWLAGGIVAWRLGLTGLQTLLRLPSPRRRMSGWPLIPLLLPVAMLAASALPVWGRW